MLRFLLFMLQEMFHSEPQHVDVVALSDGRPYSISVVHEHRYCITIPIPTTQLAQ